MGDKIDTKYWDSMVEVFIKERTISQVSYNLAKLIEYYSHDWTPERFYVCEKLLEHLKNHSKNP